MNDEQLNVTNEGTGTATATAQEEPDTSTQEKVYQMDTNPFRVKINIFPSLEKAQYVTHVMRRPTFDEEEARERKMPLIISDAGKVEGSSASSMSLDDEPGNVGMYDKIAIAVSGYALNPGEKPNEEEVSIETTIKTKDGEASIKDLLPVSHKREAINGMFPSDFEVELGDGDFYFALGGGREWVIRQEIGGKFKREDGSLSPAEYNIRHTLREPTEGERKKFRTSAINSITMRTTSGNKDRRSTNLRVLRDLYDALVLTVDGATIAGGAIDTRNRDHLAMIPATFKKGVVIKLFNFLEADLGN